MQHQNHHKFLSNAHREKWLSKFEMIPLKPIRVLKKFQDWRDKVVDWFNNWITKPYEYKQKQLYLVGPASTGKSTFIQHVLFAQYGAQVFRANSSDEKYCWENLDLSTHNLVIMDEFYYKDHDMNILKLVLAGEMFMCPKKYCDAELKIIQCPIAMISNFKPPAIEGFDERVLIVDTTPQPNQKYDAYVNFFEFLDLWLHQPKSFNYETKQTLHFKPQNSIFDSEFYKAKVAEKNSTRDSSNKQTTTTTNNNNESTITVAKRKANEAFEQQQQQETQVETPKQNRLFTFKKASQTSTFQTSTPVSSQMNFSTDEDDDFIQLKQRSKKQKLQLPEASQIKQSTKFSTNEIAQLVEETLDYILDQ